MKLIGEIVFKTTFTSNDRYMKNEILNYLIALNKIINNKIRKFKIHKKKLVIKIHPKDLLGINVMTPYYHQILYSLKKHYMKMH